MISFKDWRKKDETFRVNTSGVDDEGDGGEAVAKRYSGSSPGAFPLYSKKDLPPTPGNGGKERAKSIFSKKK